VQQELYFDKALPNIPCVYILASGGPYVEGDRLQQEIVLRRGTMAHISTGAATKIAEMSHNYAALRQRITLQENAYLEYLPEPTYPSMHSRYLSDTELYIHPTATLVYSDIYSCGRRHYCDKIASGERFCYDLLSVSCTAMPYISPQNMGRGEVSDYKSVPIFREKLLIRPKISEPQVIGIMAHYEIFANLLILTPISHRDALYAQIRPFSRKDIALSVSLLPNDAGLILRVMGGDISKIKDLIRHYASLVRMEIKGCPLPEEFPWR
jgi:urease accessory protein